MSNNTRIFGDPLKNFNNQAENFSLDVSGMTAALEYENTEMSSDLPAPMEFMEEFRKNSNISEREAYCLDEKSPLIMRRLRPGGSGSGSHTGGSNVVVTTNYGYAFTVVGIAVFGLMVVIPIIPLGSPDPKKNSKFKYINETFLSNLIESARKVGGLKFANDVAIEFVSYIKKYNEMVSYE